MPEVDCRGRHRLRARGNFGSCRAGDAYRVAESTASSFTILSGQGATFSPGFGAEGDLRESQGRFAREEWEGRASGAPAVSFTTT